MTVGHHFGGTVRSLREARGWSQEQLAGLAELNRCYIGEVERGAAVPSLLTVEKIARALRLRSSALIGYCEAACVGLASSDEIRSPSAAGGSRTGE